MARFWMAVYSVELAGDHVELVQDDVSCDDHGHHISLHVAQVSDDIKQFLLLTALVVKWIGCGVSVT